mgnify:CR=1 FL=1
MNITVKRIFNCNKYCIGKLYVDNDYLCDTLEDTDRGLDDYMSLDELKSKKVKGKTAIPAGRYRINLCKVSPNFGNKSFYRVVCSGKLPYIENVPGYEGVLIHCGNTEEDSSGCILVGYNKIKGKVINSRQAFIHLYTKLKLNKGGINIKIERAY